MARVDGPERPGARIVRVMVMRSWRRPSARVRDRVGGRLSFSRAGSRPARGRSRFVADRRASAGDRGAAHGAQGGGEAPAARALRRAGLRGEVANSGGGVFLQVRLPRAASAGGGKHSLRSGCPCPFPSQHPSGAGLVDGGRGPSARFEGCSRRHPGHGGLVGGTWRKEGRMRA
jgi:hypothetical protein